MNPPQFAKAFRPQLFRLHPITLRAEQATTPSSLRGQRISKFANCSRATKSNPTPQKSSHVRYSSKASFPKPPERPQASQINHPAPPPPPPRSPPDPGQLSLSQRLRKLSREYGWSALGVYLALTALDFPFCFIAVRWLGTDRIGHWEHVAVEWIKTMIPEQVRARFGELKESLMGRTPTSREISEPIEDGAVAAPVGLDLHAIEEAERENKGENASKCLRPTFGF